MRIIQCYSDPLSPSYSDFLCQFSAVANGYIDYLIYSIDSNDQLNKGYLCSPILLRSAHL
jgi:hypothetical protein